MNGPSEIAPADLDRSVEQAKNGVKLRPSMTKHRCVNSNYFEASKVRNSYIDMLIRKGLSLAQANLFLRTHRSYLNISDSIVDSINRNIAWCFDRYDFIPQRYNTDVFGAYYTGKEIDTSEKEYEYHYRKAKPDHPVSYTVFSLEVAAKLADLRPIPAIQAAITHAANYTLCQRIATALRAVCDGLAVPSVRNPRGNCCPIFSRLSLTPGAWVKEGEFNP